VQEGLVVGIERFGGEGLKGIGQLLARLLEEGEFLGGTLALFLDARRQFGDPGLGGKCLLALPVGLGAGGGQDLAGLDELSLLAGDPLVLCCHLSGQLLAPLGPRRCRTAAGDHQGREQSQGESDQQHRQQ